jgi:hypothetical protein
VVSETDGVVISRVCAAVEGSGSAERDAGGGVESSCFGLTWGSEVVGGGGEDDAGLSPGGWDAEGEVVVWVSWSCPVPCPIELDVSCSISVSLGISLRITSPTSLSSSASISLPSANLIPSSPPPSSIRSSKSEERFSSSSCESGTSPAGRMGWRGVRMGVRMSGLGEVDMVG